MIQAYAYAACMIRNAPTQLFHSCSTYTQHTTTPKQSQGPHATLTQHHNTIHAPVLLSKHSSKDRRNVAGAFWSNAVAHAATPSTTRCLWSASVVTTSLKPAARMAASTSKL
mmetsp:Transcript_32969/g.72893  ORF Transcript_32969/g.72893 Transcript_32969/m.72893 type:complete len:112 (-) Transcript_32969:1004-1339(-)